MYYRTFDTENECYISEGYNNDNRSWFKKAMELPLAQVCQDEDVSDISNLKWDMYVVALRKHGFQVEESVTPFNMAELHKEEIDMDAYDVEDEWIDDAYLDLVW